MYGLHKKSNLYHFSLMKNEKLWLKFIVLAARRLMFCESVAGVWISIYFFNLLANWDLSFFTNDFKSSFHCAGVERLANEREEFFCLAPFENHFKFIYYVGFLLLWPYDRTKKLEWRSLLIYFAITWRFSVELVNYFDSGPLIMKQIGFLRLSMSPHHEIVASHKAAQSIKL